MATTVAGPVVLPDGTAPAHGRVIFTLRGSIGGSTLIITAPVAAPIVDGEISVALEGAAEGTAYGVVAEFWATASAALIRVQLPDIVITGTGTGTIADYAVASIPDGARARIEWKRGDTISWPVQMLDELRRPLSLTGSTVASALQGPDGVVRALSVAVTDAATGWIEVALGALAASGLPLGHHAWDIAVTTGSVVTRTPSATVIILEEVTP